MPEQTRAVKVLILIDSLGAGGAERSLAEHLPYLRADGIRPVIACLKRKPGVEEAILRKGYEVHFLPKGRPRIGSSLLDGSFTYVRALRRLIAAEQPDLVHTSLLQSNLIGRVAAAGTGVPVLSSLVNMPYAEGRVQEDPDSNRWKTRGIQLIDALTGRLLTTHFHAITHAVKAAAARDLRLPPERITVVERGRNEERLGRASEERRRAAREKFGLAQTDEVLINVGRQDTQKGQKHLVEAMQRLVRERPKAVLLVAGRRGNASPALDQAMREAPELEECVHFLGLRDDVPELLAAADVFVFPSLYEGLGGAVLEAMALELPIVASDIGPMREVNEAGQNALLVEPGAPAPLAEALEQLLKDPERRRAFGRRGREIFEERFTFERSAQGTIDLYRRLAA